MTIRRYKVGKTYNARERVSVSGESLNTKEGAEALSEAFREMAKSTTVEGRIAPAVRWSTATLERAEMPLDPNAAIYANPDWRRRNERQSAEWYAIRILRSAKFMHMFIARGDASLAADFTLNLAEAATEGKFLFGYFGRNASNGGKTKAEDAQEEVGARMLECRRQATKLWRRHPDWSSQEVARHIKVLGAKGRLLSVGHVRKKIADLKPGH
jgi:hypothetical protein